MFPDPGFLAVLIPTTWLGRTLRNMDFDVTRGRDSCDLHVRAGGVRFGTPRLESAGVVVASF